MRAIAKKIQLENLKRLVSSKSELKCQFVDQEQRILEKNILLYYHCIVTVSSTQVCTLIRLFHGNFRLYETAKATPNNATSAVPI